MQQMEMRLFLEQLEFQSWVPKWSLGLPHPIRIPSSHGLPEQDLVPPRPWLCEQCLIKLRKGQPAALGSGSR